MCAAMGSRRALKVALWVVFIVLVVLIALVLARTRGADAAKVGGGSGEEDFAGFDGGARHGLGVLLHGAPAKVDAVDGAAVQATASRWQALLGGLPADAGIEHGYIGDQGYILEAKKGAFGALKKKTPVTVHIVSSRGFETVPGRRRVYAKAGPAKVLEAEVVPDLAADLERFPEAELRRVKYEQRDAFTAEQAAAEVEFQARRAAERAARGPAAAPTAAE